MLNCLFLNNVCYIAMPKEKCLSPSTPITALPSVGPKLAKTLEKCHLYTLNDIIFFLPYLYQDRTKITPIDQLFDGCWAVIQATITHAQIVISKRKQFIVTLNDGSGSLKVRFFYFSPHLQKQLIPGKTLKIFSQIRQFSNGSLESFHPEFDIIDENENEHDHVGETLTPIYHLTEGLSQKKIRRLCQLALDALKDYPLQCFPKSEAFPPLIELLSFLHNPPPNADMKALIEQTHPYQKILAKEELLAHFCMLNEVKENRKKLKSTPFIANDNLVLSLKDSLPFQLTKAQEKVIDEINQDLANPYPMQRLLQGDVGSGKTIVSALCALTVISQGHQVALMAPTELLAEQHFINFDRWFKPLGIKVGLLLGKQSAKAQKETQEKIANNTYQMVIGTHALFQEKVTFKKLSLVMIDEQHRFGVKQRLALQQKGKINDDSWPHLLVMSATPIPRTLAMIQYAHLNLSIIDALPPNRQTITTTIMSNEKRQAVIERLKVHLNEKKQCYFICPLIEESESLQCEAAEKTYARLKEELPEIPIGLVHGRQKNDEKNEIMSKFKANKISLLVATTVIEVGVDVPNASLMIIENAERLGLFQLHQLRGRVGRGENKSYCLLLYQNPLSKQSKARLLAIRDNTDGFKIAELDLKIRGSGEILGTRQTGIRQFKIANLERDGELVNALSKDYQTIQKLGENALTILKNRWLIENGAMIKSA